MEDESAVHLVDSACSAADRGIFEATEEEGENLTV